MSVSGGGSGGGSGGAIRAGRAFVEIFWEDNALKRGLANAQRRFAAFGRMVGSTGRVLAAAGVGAGTALASLFTSAVGRSAEFGALALKFGDTAENLSSLSYAAGMASVEQEELFAALNRFPKALNEAKDGSSELGLLFQSLGLDAEKLAAMPITEALLEYAEAASKIGQQNDLFAANQDVFGKTGAGLNEFLAGGRDEIRKAMAEAGEVGAVVTSDQAAAAKRIEDTLAKAWIAAKHGLLSVGEALLPAEGFINRVVAGIVSASQAVRGWISENQDLVIGAGLVLAGMTAVGVSLSLIGPAIGAAAAAWGAFSAVVSAGMATIGAIKAIFLTPVLLIPVAIAAAGAAFIAFTEQGRELLGQIGTAISDAFGPTLESVKESWGDIVAAIKRGDFESAWKVALATVRVEWARLMVFFEKQFQNFLNTSIIQGLAEIGQMVDEIITGEKSGHLIMAPGSPRVMSEGEAEAAAELSRAQAELDQARARAREKEQEHNRAKDQKDPSTKKADPAQAKMAEIQRQIKGAFAGAGGTGFFQAGMTGLEKAARDQLKKQDEQIKLLGHLNENVQKIDGVRFGEGD